MRKNFIRIIAYLSGECIRKSKVSLDKKKYKKAFRYLNYSEKLANLVGSSPLLNPLTLTQRLELNFLTHNFKYVLENIGIPINAIEKTLYTKKRLQKLFESESYYAENYSEDYK